VAVYGNVNAAPLTGVDSIRRELADQLTHAVRWTESVRSMIADGAETFLELGPKDVLSGLLKRIDGTKTAVPLNSAAAVRGLADKRGDPAGG
jgi:[acyl-carrier-protein] S-malonyltransferase